MKNRITFIILAACFTFLFHASCKAQPADNFAGSVKINETIELSDTPQAVTTKFGQPDDTENVYWEMDEVTATYYHYNGGEFRFVSNKLESFKFTSPTYKLKLGTFELKVGNNISTISSAFPKSYSIRSPEGTSITLGTGDYQYLSIGTTSNGVITEIELRVM